ncbi:MAG: sulfite exporter TauE/SafE family protein [Planctomycetes bacterium]|nr:sulfite exporter TauE/SafE family protein [Planctomycetota bacterium]
MQEQLSEPSVAANGPLAFLLGIIIGAAAGLIGVGGGEFRIPVLLHVLRLPVRIAAGANMVIGLFVVTLGVIRRWGQHAWDADSLTLAGIMVVASLVGSVIGVRQAHRLSTPILKRIVCGYLLVVGVWMVLEGLTQTEHAWLSSQGLPRWLLAAACGFVIAVVSGALGVAGGEMRIPALLYLFAVPIKEAGTLSLLVSIPTVAGGALTYHRLGHIPNRALAIAGLMGAGSIVGVLIGASLLPYVDKHAIKALLGFILLLATGGLIYFKPRKRP